MEAVAANTVLCIVFIWKGIHIGFCWHGLVERSVEHAHLWHFGEHFVDGVDACHVHRIVEWGNAVAFLDFCNHLIVDEHALVELFTTMHHAVTYCVNFLEVLNATVFFAGEVVENRLDGSYMVIDIKVLLDFFVAEFEFDESVG